jgi:hypothetical protein
MIFFSDFSQSFSYVAEFIANESAIEEETGESAPIENESLKDMALKN